MNLKSILSGLFFFMLTMTAHAGGSASAEDILAKLDPSFANEITSMYDLANTGACLRVGKPWPNSGERLLPCQISAWIKGREDDVVELNFEAPKSCIIVEDGTPCLSI